MRRIATLLSVGLLAGAPATAQDLKVGDAAPAIAITEWVQGDTLPGLEKGKIYLVEFWATW
jgi:hypothetical protein